MINYFLTASFSLFTHSWPTLLFCLLCFCFFVCLFFCHLCSFLIYFLPHWNGLLHFFSLNAFSNKGKKTTLLVQIYFVSWPVQFPSGYILPFLMFGPPVERIRTVLTSHNVFGSPSVFVILGLLKIS